MCVGVCVCGRLSSSKHGALIKIHWMLAVLLCISGHYRVWFSIIASHSQELLVFDSH